MFPYKIKVHLPIFVYLTSNITQIKKQNKNTYIHRVNNKKAMPHCRVLL